jgi:short-subunit dehydrogenase
MRELAGSTAILTGPGGGIGFFIARELAKTEMNLVLASPSMGELEKVSSELAQWHTGIATVLTDVRDPKSLQTLADLAIERFGAVDILINNAGINNVLAYDKLRTDEIAEILLVDLVAPMLLSRILLPGMLQRGRGHIVNISSLSGNVALPFCGPYSAAKAGLIAFTWSIRSEYRGTGVSASVVCPGFVQAGIYKKLVEETGLEVPRVVGTSAASQVARAVVKAIKHDTGEVMVSPLRTRLCTVLGQLSPCVAERLIRLLGVAQWLRGVAAIRETKVPTLEKNTDK